MHIFEKIISRFTYCTDFKDIYIYILSVFSTTLVRLDVINSGDSILEKVREKKINAKSAKKVGDREFNFYQTRVILFKRLSYGLL